MSLDACLLLTIIGICVNKLKVANLNIFGNATDINSLDFLRKSLIESAHSMEMADHALIQDPLIHNAIKHRIKGSMGVDTAPALGAT